VRTRLFGQQLLQTQMAKIPAARAASRPCGVLLQARLFEEEDCSRSEIGSSAVAGAYGVSLCSSGRLDRVEEQKPLASRRRRGAFKHDRLRNVWRG